MLQRAVVMLLEPIYEGMFHAGSFGFRPGRNAHQAIDSLRDWLVRHGGGWVVEVDIRKFFDTLDHKHLREFVQRRVGDGVVLRLIGKWSGTAASVVVRCAGRRLPHPSDGRQSPRWGDLTAAREHLPAPCAG